MGLKFQEKNTLLTNDELDKAAGGNNCRNTSWSGTPACPGYENCSKTCYGCVDLLRESNSYKCGSDKFRG